MLRRHKISDLAVYTQKGEKMNLRQIRTERKLSVPALSRLSDVPIRTIEEIEKRDDCRISTAIKLADALEVTLDELCRPAE